MDEPQKNDFNETIETLAVDHSKTKKTFWKLTATVIALEIILLSTFLLLVVAALASNNKYHQVIGNLLKYGGISLPLLSWFCSLYGLSLGRIILILASLTFTLVLAALFLM